MIYFEVTQAELAVRYGVSSSSISQRSQQILDYAEENMDGFLDDEDLTPNPSTLAMVIKMKPWNITLLIPTYGP